MAEYEKEQIDQQQIDELKENIIKQIKENSDFSQEKKEQFIQKIQSLDNEGFIQFLKKQGIIKEKSESSSPNQEPSSQKETQSTPDSSSGKQCIFCSIVFGDSPSWKIAENEKAIGVLEINPLSKGHTLVIPKEHVTSKEQIPEEAKHLAAEISEKIKSELSPSEIKFQEKNMFGHEILNIIPLYENQKLEEMQQKQESQEELKELNEKLQISSQAQQNEQESDKTESEHSEEEESINDKNTWLPRRIP